MQNTAFLQTTTKFPERNQLAVMPTSSLNNQELNIATLPGPRIAFMTGTFDPFHYGHLEALTQSLQQGADFAIILAHSFTNGKTPAPLEVRQALIDKMISNYNNIACATNSLQSKIPLCESDLFQALRNLSPNHKFVRIVGSEKNLGANSYFVHHRSGKQNPLSSNQVMAHRSPYFAMSSSQIRSGEQPMPKEYKHFNLNKYYPSAHFE